MIWFWKCKGWGHSTKTSKRSWVSWSEQSIITSLELLIFTSYYSNHHIEVKFDYLLIIVLFIDMLSSKKKQNKLNRSRSRSISLQRSNNKLGHKQGKKGHPKSGRNNQKNRSILNPSLGRSVSKKSLNKSGSHKKLGRSVSQPRLGSSLSQKNAGKKGGKVRNRSKSRSRSKSP